MFDYQLAAQFLKKCQVIDDGEIKGTVCPWIQGEGEPPREDYHDTLQAAYVWGRPEHIDSCGENLRLAMDYVKKRFDRYSQQSEPLKSYDSSFLLLALQCYQKSDFDERLSTIKDYAEEYLIKHFRSGPAHNSREYSNPYWKASMLYYVLEQEDAETDFLKQWLSQDTVLINPEKEDIHKGRGYVHPHDFFSTGGTKLMALNLMMGDVSDDSLKNFLPEGYIRRTYDETSFNASVLFGLCTLKEQNHDVERIKSKIFSTLESRFVDGGTRRGDYTELRESWPTFFVYFAELLRDNKEIL